MNDENKAPYIIRRIKKVKKNGHHGGSWKIAYADFVTAMMTFFLLMWLLSLLNKYQLEGISEFFKKPLSKAMPHQGNQINKDKNKEKFNQKEQEKEKEKPNKVDVKQNVDQEKKRISEEDKHNMEVMKDNLQKKIETDPQLRQYKNQLNFEVTADGLKIELRDMENKPMFTTGKADFVDYSKKIIAWLGVELNKYPNRVVIIGHTDTAPYESEEYNNWDLSVDRANAARRSLIKYGMGKDKIIRVIGVGDIDLLNKNNGLDPSNRRIEIVVLTDEAMKKLVH